MHLSQLPEVNTTHLVALEEEVGLEEAEQQVHDGDDDTDRAEAVQRHAILKDLRDAESIVDHASCSKS